MGFLSSSTILLLPRVQEEIESVPRGAKTPYEVV